ncbi:phosphate system positive regulatory protein pho81 [Xanthoria parietina]
MRCVVGHHSAEPSVFTHAQLKLRLKTLLDKKRMMQARNTATPKISASFITLEEGFQQFGTDLSKLQQFVETNATAFSKILKKWDKTSKSRTKELYLSRAVEVQPCFNRDVISDLSDQATTSFLELGAWAEGDKVQYDASRPSEHVVSGQSLGTDENDTDSQILQAANAGNLIVLQDWVTRLKESPDARIRFTRTFLGAIGDASQEALNVLLASGLVDLHAEDEINERNCLHEAAISGVDLVLDVGIRDGVELSRVDVYGRIPLHYACIHGHVKMVQILLAKGPRTINAKDHDNFTPLIHGIVHHQLACVEQLLSHGSRIDPDSDSDHVPLNLACQHGSIAITQLLLERKAQVLPDAEGLFPQHLVARSGRSTDMLLILEHYGADLNQQDNLYQWTPLFHAAAEGKVDCLKVLLERGVDIRILDEKGLSAMYYATWEGHLECMRLLSSTATDTQRIQQSVRRQQKPRPFRPESTSPASMTLDADGIPDLSLPPPIIPLRRYGHNFLDTKAFVQIAFGEADVEPVLFYHDSKYPAARLTISSKTTDIIPRNLMLPIQEDTRMISFQIDNLESFTLDFDIYPTFGSKIIARSVGLPSLFGAISSSSGRCCLPLFDPRLRAIGQISFEYQVIKPFQGTPLEITHFATYWKATSQLDTHPGALITGSSLSGDYAQICVQVTRDGVPVIYPRWSLNHHGVEVPISRMSHSQYLSLGSQYGQEKDVLYTLTEVSTDDTAKVHSTLATGFFTLKDVLLYLPTGVHINIQVLFPTVAQERAFDLSPSPNINSYADAILRAVFDHARSTREHGPDSMRSIVFTSYNPDICTALNWKQPNYPVLLCNNLGSEDPATSPRGNGDNDRNSFSVKEAVRTAQSNNLMGLICRSRLVDLVPALIESIKVAGLVLVVNMSEHTERGNPRVPEGVDGVVKADGVLRFNEVVDM